MKWFLLLTASRIEQRIMEILMEVSVRKDSARKRLQLIRFGSIILMKIEPRIPWHLQKKKWNKEKKRRSFEGKQQREKEGGNGKDSGRKCFALFAGVF